MLERTAAVPCLDIPQPTPTIHEILADPENLASRDDTVFVVRDAYTEGQTLNNWQTYDQTVIATTEQECLREFDQRMLELETLFANANDQSNYAEQVSDFRRGVRFMGKAQRINAATTIAHDWLGRLQNNAGELFIYVNARESSSLVYEMVTSAIQQLDVGATEHVRPVSAQSLARYIRQIQKSGLIVLEDWSLSGIQQKSTVQKLRKDGVDPENTEIHLLAAAEQILQQGAGGVACKAHFGFPFRYGMYKEVNGPSITSTHNSPPIGFKQPLDSFYWQARKLLQSSVAGQTIRMPHLYHVVSEYDLVRHRDALQAVTLEQKQELNERSERIRRSIAQTLIGSAEPL